ncbi:MAG: hypothetical protein ACRED1_02355, partial [Limisphaerales bacterium]
MQTARLRTPWFNAICLCLAIGTLALYWPTRHDAFINFDDDAYVTGNSHVKSGLTWAGVVWAFKSGYAANWHPLTWISHMTDCQLFGLDPAGHHLMNALFHAANAVLLFILLKYMTGALWRGAFAAALFAWHPLRVESVAWAAERKDVLSAFFWMLTLLCYARYAKSLSVRAPHDRLAPSLHPDPLLSGGVGAESGQPPRAFARPESDRQDPGKAKPLLARSE